MASAPWAAAATFPLDTDGGDGSVIDSSPSGGFEVFFELAGSDTGGLPSAVTSYTATAPAPPAGLPLFNVSGTWDYETFDIDGASFDPFGFLVNGVQFQLSGDLGPDMQSGTFSFLIAEGDVFG